LYYRLGEGEQMKLIIQKSVLPIIHANFDEVKTALSTQLKKYEINVTVENIAEAKAQATEINKVQKSIKELGKSAVDMHQKPINEFKDKIKELAGLCEDARQAIIKQVRVFEDARRLEARGKITEYFNSACELKQLRDEFKTFANIDAAVTLTALTTKGELNKKTKDTVDFEISKAFTAQQQADLAQAEKDAAAAAAKTKMDAELAAARAEAREETLKEVQEVSEVKEETKELKTPTETKPTEPAPKGKSVYRLKLEYEFAAQSGADADKLYKKILPMIQSGKIQPTSHLIVEIE